MVVVSICVTIDVCSNYLIFFCSWDREATLEVVRLLAQKTKEVGFEFLKYVKEQELVAGLLLVAREKVMSSPLHFLWVSSDTVPQYMDLFQTKFSLQLNMTEFGIRSKRELRWIWCTSVITSFLLERWGYKFFAFPFSIATTVLLKLHSFLEIWFRYIGM